MPIVAALRRLLDRDVEIMLVDAEPGVRVIALSWQGTATGPSAERTVQTESGNAGLLKALTELDLRNAYARNVGIRIDHFLLNETGDCDARVRRCRSRCEGLGEDERSCTDVD